MNQPTNMPTQLYVAPSVPEEARKESMVKEQPTNMPTQLYVAPSVPADALAENMIDNEQGKAGRQPSSTPTQLYVAPSVSAEALNEKFIVGGSAMPSVFSPSFKPLETEVYNFNKELQAENIALVDANMFLILLSVMASVVLILMFLRR
jgi:hypothetical protein